MRTFAPLMVLSFVLGSSGLQNVRAQDGDWPQWRGAKQDGISRETGLLETWPENGPPELWRVPLGGGFSAVSVAGGKAYTMGVADGKEVAVCLDAATGKVLWRVPRGKLFENSYGDGPRATPTIDEDRVYTLGADGTLMCLGADSGEKLWGYNLLEKFEAENAEYGLSASPVVKGKMLLVVSGKKEGKTLLALDKTSGEVLWTSLGDLPGYSTPLPTEIDGVPLLVVLTGDAVVGVSPDTGEEYWRHPWKTTMDANVATPIVQGKTLFISTGYNRGAGWFVLSADGGKIQAELAEELTRSSGRDMKNYLSTSVLLDGHLYGFNNTALTCMEFETGETKWRERGFNRGSLIAADGKLIVLGERGTLALVEASPEEYKERGKFQVLQGRCWTVPTLAAGRLYVRDEQELACLDLRKPQ